MPACIKIGIALLTGPPGTGKTMAAGLLGKLAGREVFRVDLSMVVSKYIGETEKNIASLFDDSQKLPPVLLFDEADALFGKRTTVVDTHDRYANLDASGLLQKMEDYQGLVILVANSRTTFDEAFIRRLRWAIEFSEPKPYLLWWEILLKWMRLKF